MSVGNKSGKLALSCSRDSRFAGAIPVAFRRVRRMCIWQEIVLKIGTERTCQKARAEESNVPALIGSDEPPTGSRPPVNTTRKVVNSFFISDSRLPMEAFLSIRPGYFEPHASWQIPRCVVPNNKYQ